MTSLVITVYTLQPESITRIQPNGGCTTVQQEVERAELRWLGSIMSMHALSVCCHHCAASVTLMRSWLACKACHDQRRVHHSMERCDSVTAIAREGGYNCSHTVTLSDFGTFGTFTAQCCTAYPLRLVHITTNPLVCLY